MLYIVTPYVVATEDAVLHSLLVLYELHIVTISVATVDAVQPVGAVGGAGPLSHPGHCHHPSHLHLHHTAQEQEWGRVGAWS